MKIELSADEVDYAIMMYMAIKGYKSEYRRYITNQINGLKYVECLDVEKADYDIDKLIEGIKNH